MKNYIFKSTIVLALLGSVLTSCSDFLDADNKSNGNQSADKYFTKNPEQLLFSAYYYLQSFGEAVEMNEQGTDLYFNTRGKAAGEFNEYTLTPQNSTVSTYYGKVYNMINSANGAVKYAGEEAYIAEEGRFLRNYGYYLLTQQFGAVPYTQNYIDDGANKNFPRVELATIYDEMIKDLTDLYANAKALKATDHTGHASKQAVAALLAKVLLAKGWDIDTKLNDAAQGTYTVNSTAAFAEAAKMAAEAIKLGGINDVATTDLPLSFEQKWSPKNEGNAEEIFSIQYSRENFPGTVNSGGHSLQNNFGSYYDGCNTSFLKQVGSENQMSEKSALLFEKGDQRFEGTFMTTFYNSNGVWGTEGYYAYYNADATALATMPVALRFFPYWVTEDEAKAELATIKDRLKIGSKSTVKTSKAYIIGQLYGTTATTTSKRIIIDPTTGAVTKVEEVNYYDMNKDGYSGVCVKKWDDAASEQVGSKNDYRDIVVLHLSATYLDAAEAYLMTNNETEALKYINAIRKRAGLTTALTSFDDYKSHIFYSAKTGVNVTYKHIDLILDERAREQYAEGVRWIDLRRTKQLVRNNVAYNMYVPNVAKMTGPDGNIKWYKPIPEIEINANDGISQANQNPGY